MDFTVTTPQGTRTVSIKLPGMHYGVLMSGGFDSALMLALILEARKQEQHKVPFTVYTVQRGMGAEEFAINMAGLMEEHFKVNLNMVFLGMPPGLPHNKEVGVPAASVVGAWLVGKMFSGATSNPPIDTGKWLAPTRPSLDAQKPGFKRWVYPMLHLDKSHTVAMVRERGYDFIETNSHTCTQLPKGRCGECFQCQERAWAYRTLGVTDPGEH